MLSGSPVWGLDLGQEPGKPKSIFPLKTDHPRAGKFRKPHRLDIKTVSGMLGHYSAGFTLAQRQAADVIGNVLSGAF